MSHELRTPLNTIINIPQGLIEEFRKTPNARCRSCGASYLLDETDVIDESSVCEACRGRGTLVRGEKIKYCGDQARALAFLQKIERAGQHLLQMVNGVLDFSKLEAGRFQLELASLDLGALLSEVSDQMSDIALRKGVRLEVVLPAGERVPVLADGLRIKQVLINVIANAIKFSEASGVVTLSIRSEPDAELISVEDRGIGIAPEDHERVFTSFEQVHKGDTRKYGGTGLGLSISRSLVRMHGGELSVRSELGKGATFVIRLPRAPGASASSVELRLSDGAHNSNDERGRTKRETTQRTRLG
ncbi:MAG: hypothetical protein RL385_3066 [Pseudomonadota bacterium]